MYKQHLLKNSLILLNILFGMNFVILFNSLFGMNGMVVLNILFEINSPINSRDLNQ